jgi:hypothetical protein
MIGGSWSNGEWAAGIGYQIAGKRSANAVTRLQRGDDGLVWASYSRQAGPVRVETQILLIKRLKDDTILDPTPPGERFIRVAGSDQLQLNLGGMVGYQINDDLSLEVGVAIPLLKRDVNIDGLKRALTLSVGFATTF